MSDTSKWLTITQFADQLGLSRYTVVNLVKTKKLQVFNISPGAKRPTYRLPPKQLNVALELMQSTVFPEVTQGGVDEGSRTPEAAVRNE
jgi:hypothetical protein